MPNNSSRISAAFRTRLGHALLLVFFVTRCLGADSSGPGAELRTEHFILYCEQLDAAETGRLLEAGYAQMKAFFKSEPDRKLQIKVFATRERYQAAFDNLRKVFYWNRKHRSNMGLYARETATSYIWLQPDEYLTRRLLLHELAHQFHDLVRPWNYVPSLDYCDEGLAEHFAWHNWDGKVLELGIIPQFGPIDYVTGAVRQLAAPGFDFERVAYGQSDIDYALAWGLVSFLIAEHPDKFQVWRTALNHEVDPKIAWQKQFGIVTPGFVESFQTWLGQRSQPWRIIAGQWQPWGAEIEGRSDKVLSAQAVLVKVPARLTVDFSSESRGAQGVTFGFQDSRRFFVLVRHSDRWEIADASKGSDDQSPRQIFPASNREAKAIVEPGKEGTRLRFDGHEVQVTNVTGRVGLWVQRGKGSFRCAWE